MLNWTPRVALYVMKRHVFHQEASSKVCKMLAQVPSNDPKQKQTLFENLSAHGDAQKACIEAAIKREPQIALNVFSQMKQRKNL